MAHKKILTLLTVIILSLFAFSKKAEAASYYVSATGSDTNPGTLSQPWKTIQRGVNAMAGGDTVYVRGGTYNEPVRFYYKNNTTGQYMTLMAYNEEQVIIDGTGISINYEQEGLMYVKRTDYVRIAGLKLINSSGAGIYVVSSNNIEVLNNTTHNTYTSGVGVWASNYILVDGNDISLACNQGTEEDLKIDGSSYVEVRNNRVHDGANPSPNGGEGINISGGDPSSSGSHDIRVHHNTVYNLVKLGFGVEAWRNHLYNVEVYDNISYNNSWGFIVASEQGGSDENIKIYNNIAFNNQNAGFAIPWWGGTRDGLKKNIQFINNTAYNNGKGFWIQSPQNENVIVRNTIFSQNQTNVTLVADAVAQTTVDSNLFYGSGGTYGTNQKVGDPLFVSVAAADFHLQNGSAAIDAGSAQNAPITDFDGSLRPRGAGFDIGAYEFGQTPPTPTATPRPPSPTATAGKAGDANGDGRVDGVDYVIWVNHYNQTVSGVVNGDFDGSGRVDGVDYVIWVNNYGT